MFAAIGVQPSLDFQQRDIGLTANEAEQIVAMRFDPVRPLIPARRRRRNLAGGVETTNPARTALAILTPKRLAAALRDIPPSTTASTTRLRRSSESAIPRRLLARRASRTINRPDSGIPDSIRWETALIRRSRGGRVCENAAPNQTRGGALIFPTCARHAPGGGLHRAGRQRSRDK
jgi:hypothetical protein